MEDGKSLFSAAAKCRIQFHNIWGPVSCVLHNPSRWGKTEQSLRYWSRCVGGHTLRPWWRSKVCGPSDGDRFSTLTRPRLMDNDKWWWEVYSSNINRAVPFSLLVGWASTKSWKWKPKDSQRRRHTQPFTICTLHFVPVLVFTCPWEKLFALKNKWMYIVVPKWLPSQSFYLFQRFSLLSQLSHDKLFLFDSNLLVCSSIRLKWMWGYHLLKWVENINLLGRSAST